MCLLTLAIDQHRRFPLVIAANRDEFFDRPTQRLQWWAPEPGAPEILGGRDLQSGGTWMGLTAEGRLAMITNVRDPDRQDPNAPSRGEIVTQWLRGDVPVDRFWMQTAMGGYNGFNLIAADFRLGTCHWASNHSPFPQRLGRGLWGLSNASLDTPWPKVTGLKRRVRESLEACDTVADLGARLFAALGDRAIAPDDELPATGVSPEWERVLSPAFIRTPDGRYGTRSSTVVITEHVRKHLVTHVFERTYRPQSAVALLRQSVLRDWPPRYEFPDAVAVAAPSPVTDGIAPMTGAQPQRRHRSLLAPARPPSPRRRTG